MRASYYEPGGDGKLRCTLCPHGCLIPSGKTGICRVRLNEGGELRALNYARVTSVAVDPVEKKPLYHFHPGSPILSLGTWGCNFRCEFCQNWQISQGEAAAEEFTPEQALTAARRDGSIGIAYTYNEPTIWFEYVRDTGRLVHEAGLKNVLVTNGFINPEPLRELLEVVDALNIDIKSMSDEFYRTYAGGRLDPVLRTAIAAKAKAHVEVTYLVIPTLNDRDEEFDKFGQWVARNLGEETPCHLSAYTPRYRLRREPTPLAVMLEACEVVSQHVKHVYLGNVSTATGQETRCAGCDSVLISRRGYEVDVVGLDGNGCRRCGRQLEGVF